MKGQTTGEMRRHFISGGDGVEMWNSITLSQVPALSPLVLVRRAV